MSFRETVKFLFEDTDQKFCYHTLLKSWVSEFITHYEVTSHLTSQNQSQTRQKRDKWSHTEYHTREWRKTWQLRHLFWHETHSMMAWLEWDWSPNVTRVLGVVCVRQDYRCLALMTRVIANLELQFLRSENTGRRVNHPQDVEFQRYCSDEKESIGKEERPSQSRIKSPLEQVDQTNCSNQCYKQ